MIAISGSLMRTVNLSSEVVIQINVAASFTPVFTSNSVLILDAVLISRAL